MISFFVCLALLIGGYFIYGGFVSKTFGPDDRETPAGIRGALETVMNTPSYRESAAKIADSFRACSGAQAAADCIEACIKKEK